MFTARRAATIALPALLVFGLSGCALLESQGTDTTLTGVAACAQGHTWSVDTADLAAQVLADLKGRDIKASAVDVEGTQTLTWGLDSAMTITSDYTFTITAKSSDKVLISTQVHQGESTGKAYVNADVAIPRTWDASGFEVTTTFELDGAEVTESVPFTTIETDFDDTVGIILTCDGTAMTTQPRGTEIVQKWTRSD